MNRRLALVFGLALLLASVLFTALPASTSGATNAKCGHWFSPEYDKATSKKLALDAASIGTDEGNDLALKVAYSYRDCRDKLATRRNLSIGLLIAAGLVPAAIIYVGRRDDQIATL